MKKIPISIVIPVYKKLELFEAMLTNNIKYLYPEDRLIIVNDSPDDDLRSLIDKIARPHTVLIQDGVNRGFAGACNRGVGVVDTAYFFLINSDVKLISSDWHELMSKFEKDQSIFSISLGQMEKDGRLVGANELYWDKWIMQHRAKNSDKLCENSWGEGGSSIFATDKWRQLGGFDERMNPFYWEDVDLGWRAKKRGWKCVFDPSYRIEHHHESTIASFNSREKINIIAARNQFLTNWKNLAIDKLAIHFILLPFKLMRSFAGHKTLLSGFVEAVKKILFNH